MDSTSPGQNAVAAKSCIISHSAPTASDSAHGARPGGRPEDDRAQQADSQQHPGRGLMAARCNGQNVMPLSHGPSARIRPL
jgi:hypothetical protein